MNALVIVPREQSLPVTFRTVHATIMSVAIIQGASGGLGRGLASHILRNTSLKVYALTHQSSTTDLERHLESEGKGKGASERLSVIGNIDLTQEDGLEKAAHTVRNREGKASVRLIACLAGIVSISHHSHNRNKGCTS